MTTTIVLLSGGLDSAVVLAACVGQGDEVAAIGFDYGQPHRIELEHAATIAEHYEVPFELIFIAEMPKIDDVVFAGRNLVLAAHAIALAHARGVDRIAIGCNASDWERFADCRPEFWHALHRCARGAYGIDVLTPLLYADKRDVVAQAHRLNVPIGLTWSCYAPQEGKPCGKCLACETRKDALECLVV
jgi:7-cyano-7-deazaguanine synthase